MDVGDGVRRLFERLVDRFIGIDREREIKRQALRDAYVRRDLSKVKRLTRELAKG